MPPPPDVVNYDLYTAPTTGPIAVLSDRGISPDATKLAYMLRGKWGTRQYADIAEIRLVGAGANNDRRGGTCTISFSDGAVLKIWPTGAMAIADPQRRAAFGKFIADLHSRLVDGGYAGKISFQTGLPSGGETVNRIAIAVMIGFLVVVPLAIGLAIGRIESLLIACIGLAFAWPLFGSMQRFKSAPYDPANPPNMS